MDNTSPESGQPRKNRVPFDNELIVDLVFDDSNSSNKITPRTPEELRISEQLRDRYRRALAEHEEMNRQSRIDAAKPHPDPSADSSDSGPTNGS